jgi:type II secretory pathway component GspD/PulD (secretin)
MASCTFHPRCGTQTRCVRPTVKVRKVVVSREVPEWEKQIKAQFEKRISFDFVDTPLSDAIAFLTGITGANIVLDSAAVKGDRTPVTLRISDMKFGPALDWIMRLVNLSYVLKDESVFITTAERLDNRFINRVFDSRDYISENTEAEFLELLQSLTPGAEWETGETMLRFIDGRLIIRNKKSVVDKLEGFVGKFIETSGGPKYTPWIDKE